MTNKRARIVFDTNTLLSAIVLPNSISGQAWRFGVLNFDPIASESTLEEFDRKSQKPSLQKYFGNNEERQEAVLVIVRTMTCIESYSIIKDCRDPDDNQFLALALDGQAIAIITGDKDLLDLHPWRAIPIIGSRRFVDSFNEGLFQK